MRGMSGRVAILALTLAGRLATASWGQDLTELEEQAFRAAVSRVAPSVVRIETIGGLEKVGKVLVGEGPTTGVVISSDGHIVSSAFNFVQQPASILVTLPDGQRAPAKIVARDTNRMLVLLKVATEQKLVVPTAVPREEMRPGQWTIAVGRTFDAQVPNASVGVLSATNRIWGKALQTDAKVSPNNYGGPLIDIRGRVYGILVPLSSQGHGELPELAGAELYDSGIGFAVPLVDIQSRLERWKQGTDLQPGLLGVALKGRDVNADAAEVGHVQVKSPAQAAGMQVGDRIVEVAGSPIGRLGELRHALGRYYAGEKVSLVVARGDQRLPLEVVLAAQIDPYAHPFLGVLPRRDAGEGPGVTVRWVYPGSGAERAGLRAGDRVVACAGQPVTVTRELRDRLATLVEPGGKVALTVVRGANTLNLEATVGTQPAEVPGELPAAARDTPPAADRPPVGVVPLRLPEDQNECLVYVPESYRGGGVAGLVVWLHAPGGYEENELVARWKPLCERFQVILLAPRATDPQRWQPAEAEFVRKTMDEVSKRYQLDPARVVVHGYQAGGTMAWMVALARRDMVRGIAAVDAGPPLRAPLPENGPFQSLAVWTAYAASSPLAAPQEALAKKLRDARFPVTVKQLPEARYLNEPELSEVLRWLDSLDRL